MINSDIHAALARERQKTFLAEAKAYRRAKQARSHRQRVDTLVATRSPFRWIPSWLRPDWSRLPGHRPRPAVRGRPVALRDGSKVLIRQAQSTDTPLLADSFARLSPQTRQMRFLTRKNELTSADLSYFTDVDHHDHEALGAMTRADGRGVGTARYIRHADDPQAPEIAVTIVDD
jgi:hypothetical protein